MSDRYCECNHTLRQHELRVGGRLGCIIDGCLCIDFDDEIGDPVPQLTPVCTIPACGCDGTRHP